MTKSVEEPLVTTQPPVGQREATVTAASNPRNSKLILFIAALVLLVLLPILLDSGQTRLVIEMLVWSLFAVSLNLLVDKGGLVSLGHAAYWAVGAYSVALLDVRWGVAPSIGLMVGPIAAVAAGAIAAVVAVKRSHAYFVLLTFALGEVVYIIILRWRSLTRGDDGLLGISRPGIAAGGIDSLYYFTLVIVVASIVLIYVISQSSFGFKLQATRDSEDRAASSGINVFLHRWSAFVISAFFGGVSGSLWSIYQGSVFPETAHWLRSAEGLVMIAIGGSASFLGPIIGAVLYTGLADYFARLTPYWLMGLGFVILGIAMAGLGGITSLIPGRWRSSVVRLSPLGTVKEMMGGKGRDGHEGREDSTVQ